MTVIDDYFAVFGLPRKLTVDGEALRARFYELSRAHHPDFHQGGGRGRAGGDARPLGARSTAPIGRCGTRSRASSI